ncbi:MAG TPA: hypothetical protein VJX67_01185, partial [Blastocatellia bacterium]|nr:hypothetical protein [Blastocatellia bacterium]
TRLICETSLPYALKRFMLEAPLGRALLAPYNGQPLGESARSQIGRMLVATACGRDGDLAGLCLTVLVAMSSDGGIDLRPFVSAENRQTLIRNYKALIKPGSLQGQDAFESNLGIKVH